jgi:hypothetical protein
LRVYGLAALGVALIWVFASQSGSPEPKALLPLPGANSASTVLVPRNGLGHDLRTTSRSGRPAISSQASAVALHTLPTSQAPQTGISRPTGKPRRPRPEAPGPGGPTPPASPGGTTTPTTSPDPGPAPPAEPAAPSSPSGGGTDSPGSNDTPVAAPSEGGGRTTSGVPTLTCPGPARAVTNASVVVANGVATATFQVAPGCSGIPVSLGTYRASPTSPAPFKTASGAFDAGGPFTLSAPVPACLYEADLMTGGVKLASAIGGASCTPPPSPSPPPQPAPQPAPCDHGNGQGDQSGKQDGPNGGEHGSSGGNDRSGSGGGEDDHRDHDHSGSDDGSDHRGSH